MRLLIRGLAICAIVCANASALAEQTWLGRPLADYLEMLNREGLNVIYTSDLVDDSMRFDNEPSLDDMRADLEDVLRPFGLRTVPGPAGSRVVTLAGDETVSAAAASSASNVEPIPEIVVTSSLHRVDFATTSTHSHLGRELTTRIPVTAEEAVRLTDRLPGTANGGISSRNHVRGGEDNETLFLLDGLRLYEPWHLKDFQSVTTIINAAAISGMDFYAGAYPARYGDRMSGVLSIDLRQAAEVPETELALSFFNASLLSAGGFGGEDRGSWLVSARRGNLDLIADVIDPAFGSPAYQDYLAHAAWDFGPRARLSANFLLSDDKISLNQDRRGESARASYSNKVGWVRWQADWSQDLSSDTLLAVSDIENAREGTLAQPGIVAGRLSERAGFSVVEIKQDWRWTADTGWMLQFGWNAKDLDAEYRFESERTIEPPFDTILDNEPSTDVAIDSRPSGTQFAAYTELRWQPIDAWTLDLGLRWDQQNYKAAKNDTQLSPRVSILYRPAAATEIRLGWGHYYQAQEVNELQVADAVDTFFPAQRADHYVASLSHGSDRVDLTASLYYKDFSRLRPRFENVFNTLTLLPELQFDRVRIDAGAGEAYGAELTVSRDREDLFWWLTYAWSEAQDSVSGRSVARSWDQSHALKAGMSWRWRSWDFSAAGEVHTGWPKTALAAERVPVSGGDDVLQLETGNRNARRYSNYHSIDVRASRRFDLQRGELTAFLEITNLYNRANACCVEYSLDEDGDLEARERHWLPLVPSLGVVWRF